MAFIHAGTAAIWRLSDDTMTLSSQSLGSLRAYLINAFAKMEISFGIPVKAPSIRVFVLTICRV